jgi:hypothetical protein
MKHTHMYSIPWACALLALSPQLPAQVAVSEVVEVRPAQESSRVIRGVPVRSADSEAPEEGRGMIGVILAESSDRATIESVLEDSPAQRAGLERGDMILSVNGREVAGRTALTERLGGFSVGQRIELVVERAGWRKRLELALTDSRELNLPDEVRDVEEFIEREEDGISFRGTDRRDEEHEHDGKVRKRIAIVQDNGKRIEIDLGDEQLHRHSDEQTHDLMQHIDEALSGLGVEDKHRMQEHFEVHMNERVGADHPQGHGNTRHNVFFTDEEGLHREVEIEVEVRGHGSQDLDIEGLHEEHQGERVMTRGVFHTDDGKVHELDLGDDDVWIAQDDRGEHWVRNDGQAKRWIYRSEGDSGREGGDDHRPRKREVRRRMEVGPDHSQVHIDAGRDMVTDPNWRRDDARGMGSSSPNRRGQGSQREEMADLRRELSSLRAEIRELRRELRALSSR